MEKVATRLKNGKHNSIDEIKDVKLFNILDEIHAEHIPSTTPKELHKEIARIFNDIAKTGEDLLELITGILTPLQKQQKIFG